MKKNIYSIKLISFKIAATFFCLIVFIVTFLLVLNFTFFKDSITVSHLNNAKALTNIFHHSILEMNGDDTNLLNEFSSNILSSEKDILFIKVIRDDGEVLSFVKKSGFGYNVSDKVSDYSSLVSIAEKGLNSYNNIYAKTSTCCNATTFTKTAIRYSPRSTKELGGLIIIGHSNVDSERLLNRNLYLSLIVGLFTCFISLSLALYFSQKLSRPLSKMALMFKGILTHAPIDIIIRRTNGEIVDASKFHRDHFGDDFKSDLIKSSYINQWKHAFLEIDSELMDSQSVLRKNLYFMRDEAEEESYITISFKLDDKDKNEEFYCTLAINTNEENKVQKDLVLKSVEAKRASDAKTSFLATMSHEIRTPLTSIIGFLGLLEESVLSDKQEKYVKTALGSSENLLALINDILDYSRIESKDFKLEYSGVSLEQLCIEIASVFEHQMREKNLDFFVDIDHECKNMIEADNIRIRQILINLVGNAIKFTSKGSVSLVVQFLAREQSFQRMRFNVYDTGIGIKEENLSNIFEQFTQADNSISRNFGGTGLGLSITKKLINMMGGTVHVSSEYGKGSHFFFDLEFKILNNSEIAISQNKKKISSNVDYSNKKVLVVDDDESNRQLITLYLAKYGINLDVCDNGQDAIKMVTVTHYDLVLLDIQMPGMDGVETLLEIREHERMNNMVSTPVFAFTANVYKEQLTQYHSHGFNGHLLKPFKKADLIEFITKNLS